MKLRSASILIALSLLSWKLAQPMLLQQWQQWQNRQMAVAQPKAGAVPQPAAGTSPPQALACRTDGGGTAIILHSKPMTPLEHNNLAVQYGCKGLWAQALPHHMAALTGEVGNRDFRQNLSCCAWKLGQQRLKEKNYHPSISLLRFAIYVDPENAAADKDLDTALRESGIDADNLKVRKAQAEKLAVDGNYVESIAEYSHYLRLLPDDAPVAHYAFGCVLIKQGKTAPIRLVEGCNELRLALTKYWLPDEKKYLASCHVKLGAVLSTMADIARQYGDSAVADRRLMKASIEYSQAVAIDPLNNEALQGLLAVVQREVVGNL